jgi:hypothetical protein
VIHDCAQRSPEWFAARAGRLTGSCANDITGRLKNGDENAARRDLRTKLALERLTGQSLEDDYINGDMRRGIELEPDALAAYEAFSGNLVTPTGFLAHTDLLIGCSLDGHIGDFDGLVELKAPRPANHLKYLKGGVLPPEYRYQVTHNLYVTGARWADFVSFCPAFPEPLRLFVVRVQATEKELASYELLLRMFLKEVDEEFAAIQRLASQEAAVA